MKALRKEITEKEMDKKFLRSLTEKWETKVTVIGGPKDLSKFAYDDMIGDFLSHELIMDKRKSVSQEKKKSVALKIYEGEKKSVEDEINHITRKMKRFYETFKRYRKDT